MDFIITGTRAYGPAREDSDLDIVVKQDDVQSILDYLVDHKISTYSTPGQDSYGDDGGFYFDLFGIKVNIIVAQGELEFNLWQLRTERMKTLPDIEDRDTRLAVFRNEEGGDLDA
jgi:hypothetical protein